MIISKENKSYQINVGNRGLKEVYHLNFALERVEKIKLPGDEKRFLKNILNRKVIWNEQILRINCLDHDSIEGLINELKGLRKKKNAAL